MQLLICDLDGTLVESWEKTLLPGVHGYRLLGILRGRV
jgi:hydroxymethylpyrimidine pyrophosphatase-like HAD family hydrolase